MVQSRRAAREFVLKALYAIELSGKSHAEALKDPLVIHEAKGQLQDFCDKLLKETLQHQDEFDELIRSKAINWKFERLAVIDKLVLRMALCEFLHFEDIPPKVTIDEAIEVTRKYSTEKSDKFVNGILDAVLNDLIDNGRINKTGRGLVQDSPALNSAGKSEGLSNGKSE